MLMPLYIKLLTSSPASRNGDVYRAVALQRVEVSQAATTNPSSPPRGARETGGLGWPTRPFKVLECPSATYQKFLLFFIGAFRPRTSH